MGAEAWLRRYWHHVLEATFYAVHLYAFFFILYDVGSIVATKCHGTWSCRRRLQSAQPWGLVMDLSDGQWREFRQFILLFIAVAVVSVIADRLYQMAIRAAYPADWQRLALGGKIAVGVISLLVQHGLHSFIIAVLMLLAYRAPRCFSSRRLSLLLVWGLGLSILLLKESYRLLEIPSLYPYMFWLRPLFDQRFGGMYRWQLPANFLALRVISYGVDCVNALHPAVSTLKPNLSPSPKLDSKDKPIEPDAATLVISPQDAVDPQACAAYLLYAPLYIAGPVMAFHAFLQSCRHPYPASSHSPDPGPWIYALRWLASFVVLEALLYRFPVFAVANSGLLGHLSVLEAAVVVYLLLKAMWLKFLLLWRFFRCWAMFDGVLPPENMRRCMSNNYSLEQFWRGWHASFNLWLVRYLYVPLGGRTYRFLSVWPIFLFVALWHDVEWRLVVWGALNAAFFGLESLLRPATGYRRRAELLKMTWVQTLLASVACAGYILVLMAINLVGYALGTGGLAKLLAGAATSSGLIVLLGALYFLAVGVNIMFALQRTGWVADL